MCDLICHNEQLEAWGVEIVQHFAGWLNPSDYEDTLAIHRAARDAAEHVALSAIELAAKRGPDDETLKLIARAYDTKMNEIQGDSYMVDSASAASTMRAALVAGGLIAEGGDG